MSKTISVSDTAVIQRTTSFLQLKDNMINEEENLTGSEKNWVFRFQNLDQIHAISGMDPWNWPSLPLIRGLIPETDPLGLDFRDGSLKLAIPAPDSGIDPWNCTPYPSFGESLKVTFLDWGVLGCGIQSHPSHPVPWTWKKRLTLPAFHAGFASKVLHDVPFVSRLHTGSSENTVPVGKLLQGCN